MKPTPGSQAAMMNALKRLQVREMPDELEPLEARCDLCGTSMTEDHRHLLQLDERRIVCVCEACWALRSGDAEFRPTGSRTLWLDGFALHDDLWARLRIPISLAFFLRTRGGTVAFYPSPAGATESEIDASVWDELVAANPVLDGLEPEAEVLIVNRLADPAQVAIAPTDRGYELVGIVKANWQGISGGPAIEGAVRAFFAELRERAT